MGRSQLLHRARRLSYDRRPALIPMQKSGRTLLPIGSILPYPYAMTATEQSSSGNLS